METSFCITWSEGKCLFVYCVILFRSLTDVQRAAALLRRSGLAAEPLRLPTALARGSCAQGIRLRENYLAAAMERLEKSAVRVTGVYDVLPDGRYREVLW